MTITQIPQMFLKLHPTDFLNDYLDAGAEARAPSSLARGITVINVVPVWCTAPLYAGPLGGARHHQLRKSSVQLF